MVVPNMSDPFFYWCCGGLPGKCMANKCNE